MSCRCQATLPSSATLQLWSQQVRWSSSVGQNAILRWQGQCCVLPWMVSADNMCSVPCTTCCGLPPPRQPVRVSPFHPCSTGVPPAGLRLPNFPGYRISVKYATEHRCGVVVSGTGLSDQISGTDPLKDNLPLQVCPGACLQHRSLQLRLAPLATLLASTTKLMPAPCRKPSLWTSR